MSIIELFQVIKIISGNLLYLSEMLGAFSEYKCRG